MPDAGDPQNVNAWADALVYIAPIGTSLPANAAASFPVGWEPVGLLDGDAGFEFGRAWDTTDFKAWGVGVFFTSEKGYKETVKWSCFDETPTVRQELLYPGSTESSIVVPRPKRLLMAFETTIDTDVLRLITAGFSKTMPPPVMVKEGEPSKYEFETTIFPDADGQLYVRQAAGIDSF